MTSDGSHTVRWNAGDVTYHSMHGAIQESQHVFMASGLDYFPKDKSLHIFEMGFGTGLNALLALMNANHYKRHIHYTSVESRPLDSEITDKLNYPTLLDIPEQTFHTLHTAVFDNDILISTYFTLHKKKCKIQEFAHQRKYDLIFYDAFGPGTQPGLWQEETLRPLYNQLKTGGLLVTYCAQGAFKRALKKIGFEVIPLPGPSGKREITQAWKR